MSHMSIEAIVAIVGVAVTLPPTVVILWALVVRQWHSGCGRGGDSGGATDIEVRTCNNDPPFRDHVTSHN